MLTEDRRLGERQRGRALPAGLGVRVGGPRAEMITIPGICSRMMFTRRLIIVTSLSVVAVRVAAGIGED